MARVTRTSTVSQNHSWLATSGIAPATAIAATIASNRIFPSSPRVLPAARPKRGVVDIAVTGSLLLRHPARRGQAP